MHSDDATQEMGSSLLLGTQVPSSVAVNDQPNVLKGLREWLLVCSMCMPYSAYHVTENGSTSRQPMFS